ncbi:cytochrome c peroxidase [Stenotrophomonas rhizophila]|uniref:cytochrome-c peroxidase n=1 Tax=Stenotrophomonas rhizophila TaxID=216778 RepID=UPI002A6ADC9E|nr:cytochrome c peroxidase [Stenotrophomonas rhizophila]MDY0954692.1 cytochrome c peroxidase [Stenotrophomonas rhizophila]
MPRHRPARLIPLVAALLLGGAGMPLPERDSPCPAVLPVRPDPTCLRALYSGPSAGWPAPEVAPGVAWQELATLGPPPQPRDNPSTPAKIALGQRLFNDPRLSRSGQIACASCHERDLGFADGRRVSFGHDRQPGRRNAPSVTMAAYAHTLFWDGRAATLEDQALEPIADPKEMAFRAEDAASRVRADADYRTAFAAVFGDDRVDTRQLAQAIAAFERSLAPTRNRFDRFLGGQSSALDDAQLRGLHLFRTRAGCMNCHSGPALTDNGFHNLGLHFHGRARQDLGRYEVTAHPADSGRFRTPSLRGVANTAPYMHNGLLPRLDGVLAFYNVGGGRPRAPAVPAADAPPFPQPDPLLRPRGLSRQELQDLEAFLRAL